MRDLDRLKTIQAVIEHEMKPGRAAERLGLTVRQIERLVIRYQAEGPMGLISRHRNRTGNRALKAPLASRLRALVATEAMAAQDSAATHPASLLGRARTD
jgi:hypothetical protein